MLREIGRPAAIILVISFFFLLVVVCFERKQLFLFRSLWTSFHISSRKRISVSQIIAHRRLFSSKILCFEFIVAEEKIVIQAPEKNQVFMFLDRMQHYYCSGILVNGKKFYHWIKKKTFKNCRQYQRLSGVGAWWKLNERVQPTL